MKEQGVAHPYTWTFLAIFLKGGQSPLIPWLSSSQSGNALDLLARPREEVPGQWCRAQRWGVLTQIALVLAGPALEAT